MRKLEVKQLTAEAFKPYGTFATMLKPAEHITGRTSGFFPERVIVNIGNPTSNLGVSVTMSEKSDVNVIEVMEYHTYTGEGILPLDGDIIVQVAIPFTNIKQAAELVECFYVPQGTVVTLNPGVWHCAPFAVDKDVSVEILLPVRTYFNDCTIETIPEELRSGL